MAILGKFIKQPDEVLDYEFDFTPWLADRSDTIVSQTVTAAALPAAGIVPSLMAISAITNTLGVIRFYASGGTSGVKYEVTCTITTASTPARVKQSEMIIAVKEA